MKDTLSAASMKLVEVIQQLSLNRNVEEIRNIVKYAARELVNSDGATFVLKDQDQCYYVDEYAISPLWKGRRFPMSACISGWAMLNKQTVAIEDIYQDPRVPQDAYRSTFVKSLVMVPIRTLDPIGAIGNYWQNHHRATPEEIQLLAALADSTSIAIENARAYLELEERVRLRTGQLQAMNEGLEAFSYSVSHDLRAPLRVIGSFSKMLREDKNNKLSEQSLKLFSRIEGNVARMNELINALLQLAKITHQETHIEKIDMSAMCEEILQELAENDAGRNVVWKIEPLLITQADKKLLRILLNNLLINAWKFTSKTSQGRIIIYRTMKNGQTVFCISDNGVGFDSSEKKIFHPFQRFHSEEEFSGTGIGLSTVQRIIELHGGMIGVESVVNEGATFYFTLPPPSAIG